MLDQPSPPGTAPHRNPLDAALHVVTRPYERVVSVADVLPSVSRAPMATMTTANIIGDAFQMAYGVMANAEIAQVAEAANHFWLNAVSVTFKVGALALVFAHLMLAAGERARRCPDKSAELEAAARDKNPFIRLPTQLVMALEKLADALTDNGTFRFADAEGKSRPGRLFGQADWQGLSPEIKNAIGFGIWAAYTGLMCADAALKLAVLGFSAPLLVPLLVGGIIALGSLHFLRMELLNRKNRLAGPSADTVDVQKAGVSAERAGKLFYLAGTSGIGGTLLLLALGLPVTHPMLIASMACFAVGHRALQHFQRQSAPAPRPLPAP